LRRKINKTNSPKVKYMRTKFLLIVSLVLFCSLTFAQRARIVTEAVSPHQLETLNLTTNSVSTGLDVVAKETYVYLSAQNIGNIQPITSAAYTFVSRPAGSAATLESINDTWTMFRPDVNGAYTVRLTITTSGGSHDTTKTIYASNFVGVGNFEGIPAQYPNCMTCHQNTPKFQNIFDNWKVSKHATVFQRQITTGAAHYNESCLKCHTTGYDHNIDADNNGFDDIAATLGWVWQGPPNPGKWDSIKTFFPGLVQFATIGCENCHGPGSEHTMGGNPQKIDISLETGVCAQCHDEPWRHNKVAQWENSLHSEALWSNSFAQGAASQNNSLANCIRCHDGKGYVNFTKGMTTNTTGMVQASHVTITCQTCHDPHGNDNHASLRNSPAGTDTLATGFQYTLGGTGKLCMDCHKARGDIAVQINANMTMRWGPHHSVQTDNLFGRNVADFGTPFMNSPHMFAVENTCVTCHMTATVDTGNVNRDKVGGHSFSLHNEETGYDHTAACVPCHGQRESFQSFTARIDYDEDGQIESVRDEIDGLVHLLANVLPPNGVDSISWQDISNSGNVDLKKAYWNYQMIAYDGSGGMHNPMFAIDVMRKSIMAIGGPLTSVEVEDAELPETYVLAQNFPNPFNPSTTIRYSIPFESNVKVTIYSLTGELVSELVNKVHNTGTYETMFSTNISGRELASGIYFYNIEAASLDGSKTFRDTKKMILMK
jgi:hypothetical protein